MKISEIFEETVWKPPATQKGTRRNSGHHGTSYLDYLLRGSGFTRKNKHGNPYLEKTMDIGRTHSRSELGDKFHKRAFLEGVDSILKAVRSELEVGGEVLELKGKSKLISPKPMTRAEKRQGYNRKFVFYIGFHFRFVSKNPEKDEDPAQPAEFALVFSGLCVDSHWNRTVSVRATAVPAKDISKIRKGGGMKRLALVFEEVATNTLPRGFTKRRKELEKQGWTWVKRANSFHRATGGTDGVVIGGSGYSAVFTKGDRAIKISSDPCWKSYAEWSMRARKSPKLAGRSKYLPKIYSVTDLGFDLFKKPAYEAEMERLKDVRWNGTERSLWMNLAHVYDQRDRRWPAEVSLAKSKYPGLLTLSGYIIKKTRNGDFGKCQEEGLGLGSSNVMVRGRTPVLIDPVMPK